MSRILVCYPGPSWSVKDVADGHIQGLRALGHEVRPYDLTIRLVFYEQALYAYYLRTGTKHPEEYVTRLASEKILVEAVRYQPDLVHFVSGMTVHPIAYADLRKAGFVTSLYLTECPYEDGLVEPAIEYIDHLFVNDLYSVEHYAGRGITAHYLPHAYNPDVHYPQPVGKEYQSDVFLVGTGFPERIALLEQIDWTGIDFHLHGFWELGERSPLRQYYHPGSLPNSETAKYYSGAKIALNPYRSNCGYDTGRHVERAYSINPRAYEIAACGGFQLSDCRPELAEVFGASVTTYPDDGKRLGDLIRYYLTCDGERRQMAEQAKERVAQHTYETRMAQMIEVIAGKEARKLAIV